MTHFRGNVLRVPTLLYSREYLASKFLSWTFLFEIQESLVILLKVIHRNGNSMLNLL